MLLNFPQKRFYRVKWPNGNVELVVASDEEELFLVLDEEAPPFDAEIEEVELDSMRIDLARRLYTMRRILELPTKRKISKNELDRVVASLYGIPNSVFLH